MSFSSFWVNFFGPPDIFSYIFSYFLVVIRADLRSPKNKMLKIKNAEKHKKCFLDKVIKSISLILFTCYNWNSSLVGTHYR